MTDARKLCAASEQFTEAVHTPPILTVLRGTEGPFMVLGGPDGVVTLYPADIDAVVRLARDSLMIGSGA
jgi:hypothetical protein